MVRVLQLSFASLPYPTKLRITVGLVAGFISSLSIIVVVTAILVLTGNDIWTAARLIATSVFGDAVGSGWPPVAVGTAIHLFTGTFFGGLFAGLVPRMPANFYVVAGIIYGLLVWMVMGLVVLPLGAQLLVASRVNVAMLLLAHIIYGFVLGTAAGVLEVMVAIPKRVKI